jgi:hypothetical protein
VQSQCDKTSHKNEKAVRGGVAPICQKTVALNTWVGNINSVCDRRNDADFLKDLKYL